MLAVVVDAASKAETPVQMAADLLSRADSFIALCSKFMFTTAVSVCSSIASVMEAVGWLTVSTSTGSRSKPINGRNDGGHERRNSQDDGYESVHIFVDVNERGRVRSR